MAAQSALVSSATSRATSCPDAVVPGAGERLAEPEERLAGAGDRALELPERPALDAVRARARLDHRLDDLDLVRPRQGHDPCGGQQVVQPPRRLDPVEHRHVDVHQHDVGLELERRRDRLAAVRGLADDLDLAIVREHRPQQLARLRRVVADQQPNHVNPPSAVLDLSPDAGRNDKATMPHLTP